MANEVTTIDNNDVTLLVNRALLQVRPDMQNNPYIIEAIKVLSIGGYRSAIGSFWNAVVDDLRNKIIFRSLSLFNKEINTGHTIKTYDDFINYVNDDQLIDGAYKIGVIGWEANRILKQAKEIRHIFYGHPKSSEPSLIKVLAIIDDCTKYVLNAEYPAKIIDINDYIEILKTDKFDRNTVSIENALNDLPDTYKNELINRLFTIYICPETSSILSSNIEYLAPLLWKFLGKENKIQVARRIDQEIPKGNAEVTSRAFVFINNLHANQYLSVNSRKYIIEPLVNNLKSNLDQWQIENDAVKQLSFYSDVIPDSIIDDYVWAITHTYVGYVGSSIQWARTDFFANVAAYYIPDMFQSFNDRMISAFIMTIKNSELLKQRIRTPSKLRRLKTLGMICFDKASESFSDKDVLKMLIDDDKEPDFLKAINS